MEAVKALRIDEDCWNCYGHLIHDAKIMLKSRGGTVFMLEGMNVPPNFLKISKFTLKIRVFL